MCIHRGRHTKKVGSYTKNLQQNVSCGYFQWYENDQLIEDLEYRDYNLIAKWNEIQSLEFELSDDETYYIVIGIGNITSTNIQIPSTYKGLPVKKIKSTAFNGNKSITSITIPNSIENIEASAFYNCINLTNVYFEENSKLTVFEAYLFNGCTSLENIKIPEGVTTIKKAVFMDCKNLIYVELPQSLNKFTYDYNGSISTTGSNTFIYCTNLEKVYYRGTIEDWCNISFDGIYANPMYYAKNFYIYENEEFKEVTEIEVPNTITQIGKYQFCGFDNLTSVKLSYNTTRIETGAFEDCINLESIEFTKAITNIGGSAFSDCSKLDNVYYVGTIEDWLNIKFSVDTVIIGGGSIIRTANPLYK